MEKSNAPLSVDKIVSRMLNMAQPLIEKYRLRFGKKDRMEFFLIEQKGVTKGELSNYVRREILSFAPYRLLTSFLQADEVKNFNARAKHRYIRKNAAARFGGNNPMLYKFVDESDNIDAIEIDPTWREYLLENIAIVRGWVRWHWVLFLEARNPNRPNIAKQILPETNREGVGNQRRFWRQVMGCAQIKCLYSGKDLTVNNFVLDHYIPFSFIGHNQVWNLHPVTKQANSDKSDSLPNACYFDGFVKQQQTAMAVCWQQKITTSIAKSILAEYGEGLNIDVEKEASSGEIKKSYKGLISPLMTIARSYGFSALWKYEDGDD